MDIGAVGVLDIGGEIADDGEPGVFQTHGGVVLRPFLTNDGILESGFLEGGLPVVHPLDQVGPPFFRRRGIYIIDNGLPGLHEFTALPFLHVLRLWFEAPADDKVRLLHLLLVVAVDGVVFGKVADTRVCQSLGHGGRGQQDEGSVGFQGHRSGGLRGRKSGGWEGGATAHGSGGCGGEGLHRPDLGVDRKTMDAFDVRSVGHEPTQAEATLLHGVDRHGLVVALEEIGHIEYHTRRVFSGGLYVKGSGDRIQI